MSATPDTELPTRHAFASRAAEKARRRELWAQALRQRSVWLRAAQLGLTAGFVQAAVNQGDHWLNGQLDHRVIVKSVVSPLIGFALVLFSAAQTWVYRTLEQETP